jgi:gas vesicle protein
MEEKKMADNNGGFFKGFLVGGILGAVLGALITPKSGKELREQLSDETEKFLSRSRGDIENAKKAALHVFEKNMDKIIDKLREQQPVEPTKKETSAEPKKKKTPPKRTASRAKTKVKKTGERI